MLLIFSVHIFSQEAEPVQDVHFNNWSLIIYRPYNNGDLNTIRCWLKIEDEQGNDVTYSAVRSAKYEWVNGDRVKTYKKQPGFSSVFNPNVTSPLYDYERTYYLSGGMAMHLNLLPGKYKFSFYTPEVRQFPYNSEIPCDNKGQWNSNIFEYNTDNPTNVIFVSPTANDNGFYNGGWWIDYKAAEFYKFTKPKMN